MNRLKTAALLSFALRRVVCDRPCERENYLFCLPQQSMLPNIPSRRVGMKQMFYKKIALFTSAIRPSIGMVGTGDHDEVKLFVVFYQLIGEAKSGFGRYIFIRLAHHQQQVTFQFAGIGYV